MSLTTRDIVMATPFYKRKFFILFFLSLIIATIYVGDYYDVQSSIKFTIYFYDKNDFNFDVNSTNNSFCIMPTMFVDDPSLSHLMKHYDPLNCSSMKNWVRTDDGKFYIEDDAVQKYGMINCTYYDIKRVTEEKYEEVKFVNFQNASSVLGDGFRVKCKSKDAEYTNVHFTVPELKTSEKPIVGSNNNPLKETHVLFYLLDSMSRINFIRKLPKFYKLLTSQMNGIVMESFNIVGDGTPMALIPLTTGHYQYELPEARKRFGNSTFLDNWPFIYKDYKNAGYGTVFAEEQPKYNAYTYKLKGFNKIPVDHYFRQILLVADKERVNHKKYCLGDTPKSLVWLDYWIELKKMYEKYDRRTFSILFSSETSHDDYNLVQSLDDHLTKSFNNLYNHSHLNNTFLIVMGDHGRRFGAVRQSQSGKLEEKLPFLAVIPPIWFKNKFPESYANLLKNKNRLMTVFDLHATLKHMLNFTDGGTSDLKDRGISLFKEIPSHRTCRDATIKPHFCACLEWKPILNLVRNGYVLSAVDFVVREINSFLIVAKNLCSKLKLLRVISAQILKPNDNLMSFKQSVDYDNYEPDLSAKKNLSTVLYQIRFTTTPGDADWEVTVNYFIHFNSYKFSEDNLSRLNMYGDQPKCIIDTYPHLRSYCFCKSA